MLFLQFITILSFVVMGRCDLSDFFKIAKGNLTKITWAHSVNSYVLLDNALSNNVIMMLEADVSLGADSVPIMAHPPSTTSDLTLQQFIANVTRYNAMQNDSSRQKGIKLDFKTIEVFKASTRILMDTLKEISYPVMLNADILSGPVNATTITVNANDFIATCKQFPNITLSLGWTTYYNNNLANESYTNQQIESMQMQLKSGSIMQPITFPVRAALAAESLTQMQTLISNVPHATLTIWSAANDLVNIEHLRSLIFKIGLDKVYVDVPDDISNQLHLESSANRAGQSLLSVMLTTVLLICISKIF